MPCRRNHPRTTHRKESRLERRLEVIGGAVENVGVRVIAQVLANAG
ncbi:MAG: hypothetical protein AAF125_14410 [Chloroflexota bacterium]